MGLFGVFGNAARLYILLWRHSLPAAALAIGAVWAAEAALDQTENLLALFVGLTALLLALAAPMLVQGMLIEVVPDASADRPRESRRRRGARRSSGLVTRKTGRVVLIVIVVGALEYGLPLAVSEREVVYYALTTLVTPYVAHVLSALYYRLTDPARPVIAPRHSSSGSAWDEHALEDARQAR